MNRDRTSATGIVRALVVAQFMQGIGASAVLPMLPLFLRDHGTSRALIGAVMAAFFVAGVLTQYAAGHTADRLGHRHVIVTGLVLYALGSVLFLAPVGTVGYLLLRALQGIGAGGVQVAGLALVGVVIPVERRGRAFARVFAAQLAGMAIGPLAGGVAGLSNIRWLFVGTAVASLVAVVPVALGTPARAVAVEVARAARVRVTRALAGVLIVGVVGGLVTGVYETCWTLLMTGRGAAVWQVGLSWTLFAVPFAAFSPVAGRLTDRLDRRWLAGAAMAASVGFAVAYPFVPSVALLVGLGSAEAIGVAVAFPAAQSLLSQAAPREALGRAQGVFTTMETAAIAVAAGVSGYLFSLARWVPFVAAAAVGAALITALPVLWRGMPGRAADAGARHEPAVTLPSGEPAVSGTAAL